MLIRLAVAIGISSIMASCHAAPTETASPTTTTITSLAPTTTSTSASWQVGQRPLPRRPDGFGVALPTPPELQNRSLPSPDRLAPPADGRFTATIQTVPDDVLARSTWQPDCPVDKTELRYLTVSFWGFDQRPHTGELLVNARAAEGLRSVFSRLYQAKFPIEDMRISAPAEQGAAPTGDGNNTTAFVCRPARGQTRWSAHAYGLAIDINPFCNPYLKGDVILPELASAYADRRQRKPGMIHTGDTVTTAFANIGWTWGGTWQTPKDYMHFSATGN